MQTPPYPTVPPTLKGRESGSATVPAIHLRVSRDLPFLRPLPKGAHTARFEENGRGRKEPLGLQNLMHGRAKGVLR
jgi:hypothetical protein